MTTAPLTLAQLRERNELFPMLTLCHCVSDAEESRNGPRYSAQDKINECMYEMRCLPLEMPNTESGVTTLLHAQQLRLDALIAAAEQQDLPPCVSLPIDVYVQELTSTKEYFVVSVSSCMGLSLGDFIHAGCRLVEEVDFEDILRCVEAYGLVSTRLPPHRNLTLSALLRQLAARPGAVEISHRSRWVIADWLLLSDNTTPVTPDEVLGDLEWLLYSAFSKLNVSCDFDGTLLKREVIEMRINATIDRIRRGLRDSVVSLREVPLNGDAHKHETSRLEEEAVTGMTTATTGSMRLADRVALHQSRLQRERQFIRRCRGGGGTLRRGGRPPLEPTGANGARRPPRPWSKTTTTAPAAASPMVMEVSASHALSEISPAGANARLSLGGQDEVVLEAATVALEEWAQRDAHRSIAEDEACRQQRDAFRTMLMRYTAISSKGPSYPSREAIRLSQGGVRQLTHGVFDYSPRDAQTTTGRVSRGMTTVEEVTVIQVNSSYESLEREQEQKLVEKGERKVVFSGVSIPNINIESGVVTRQEVNTVSDERLQIRNSPPERKEVPMLCLKNIINNIPVVSKSGRKNGQKKPSTKVDLFFAAQTTETSPLFDNFVPTKNQRSTNGNTRSAPQRGRSIYSVHHDLSGTSMRSQRTGENKVTFTLNNTPVIATARNHGERVSSNLLHPWRSEESSRLPPRRSRSANTVNGSVSRGQVRPVNETSLGITLRRRQAGIHDGVC
ncbi:uncharacterized protein TM35_000072550 [Trypanosoma theileri]|uniref:Uncharacterized protein n=1 Tax=Trypanosoma theileri TaxID=67003 RepID=A0A1X0P1V6_9TRYP|nr:uncharacterized protein TM35_000072550 [Trypanosoma theileri]ORC90831.1 hypothetical protein TM35_000072550 [Trypanosoma theileri]